MSLRDVGFYIRGRLTAGASRVMNRRRDRPLPAPAPIQEVLRGPASAPALIRLLENRGNPAREAAVAQWLTAHGVPFARHRFQSFEGRGENFGVEVGGGDRVLILAAHHDAVPGSPGANDNAAAVAILLSLLPGLERAVSRGLRVRLLFTACEELGYLGARAYVRDTPLASVAGVLSLELCGIGDSLAVWDATEETPFRRSVTGALEGLGLRADEGYHVVGRIPVFGSDHRAFAEAGVPAYGLSIVPFREAASLRRFVLSPGRSALMYFLRRPVPFDTYHTRRDAGATIDAAALERVRRALQAIIAAA